jgi:hypothetical protein
MILSFNKPSRYGLIEDIIIALILDCCFVVILSLDFLLNILSKNSKSFSGLWLLYSEGRNTVAGHFNLDRNPLSVKINWTQKILLVTRPAGFCSCL